MCVEHVGSCTPLHDCSERREIQIHTSSCLKNILVWSYKKQVKSWTWEVASHISARGYISRGAVYVSGFHTYLTFKVSQKNNFCCLLSNANCQKGFSQKRFCISVFQVSVVFLLKPSHVYRALRHSFMNFLRNKSSVWIIANEKLNPEIQLQSEFSLQATMS